MGHRQTDGARKWTYFYLYVILDVFNRRAVEARIADAETAALFKPLFDAAVVKHDIMPGQLTLPADRGAPMKAKATALLPVDLGVAKSHSRPHTSNDNPVSESCFKTRKPTAVWINPPVQKLELKRDFRA